MPFIVLEGLDGAGKSTQLNMLKALLTERGLEYEYLHFPRFEAPVYGQLIARFLRGEFGSLDQVNPWLVALIFAGDRAEAASMMRCWLAEGKYVIADRFVYSNVAYQCAKVENDKERDELKQWVVEFEFGHNALPRPDVSLFLDVPFHFTESRLAEQREGDDREYLNGAKDIHEESMELQRRVREMYLECAKDDERLVVIDCSDGLGAMDTPENNFNKIAQTIQGLI